MAIAGSHRPTRLHHRGREMEEEEIIYQGVYEDDQDVYQVEDRK